MTRFTLTDLERAHAEWGCNCGPATLAAVCDLTLDEARVFVGAGFSGWMNLTQMLNALRSTGRDFSVDRGGRNRPDWPRYGIARIQFEGPWTAPGANPRWAYRHTHWVGVRTLSDQVAASGARDTQIWDINAFNELRGGWLDEPTWTGSTVPFLTSDIKRATGGWHITHAIEVSR
jgi:hypothetical protein